MTWLTELKMVSSVLFVRSSESVLGVGSWPGRVEDLSKTMVLISVVTRSNHGIKGQFIRKNV